MAFSYNIGDTTDTSSQIRLQIGDTQFDPDGMLPEGRNFQDAELDYFYTTAGNDFWSAIAMAFDAAAAAWSPYPSEFRLGPETQKLTAAEYYAARAETVRSEQGRRGVGSRAVTRADGYSDDKDSVTA